MAKTRTRRPRQTVIPGSVPDAVPAIDDAADAYRDARDARMELLKEEIELQEKLLEAMHAAKLTTYETISGYVVTVAPKEKVSVKRKPGANGEDNDDE